jgi:hypothetical protein
VHDPLAVVIVASVAGTLASSKLCCRRALSQDTSNPAILDAMGVIYVEHMGEVEKGKEVRVVRCVLRV